MTEAMKQLKVRTSLAKVKMDMESMNDKMSKVADAITKMTEDNNKRDHKLEELIKGFSTGIQERNKMIDKKFEGMEKKIEIKIEEKFETRISAIEKEQ